MRGDWRGLALGGILGIIGFLRITVWSAFSTIYARTGCWWRSSPSRWRCVGVVLWARSRIAPAILVAAARIRSRHVVGAAFVATLVDVTGLVIYFTVGIVVCEALSSASAATLSLE
jgi:magnesium transporter